jgi:class I fructose-bisphosphate aldolase
VDSRTGKSIRLGRLIDEQSGRTIIVAYSHGLLLGPLPGMRTVTEMEALTDACRSAEGIMVSPGMIRALEQSFIGRTRPSLVVHLDWTNFSRSVVPYEQGSQASAARIEEVAAAGADAVMTYLILGDDNPHREAEEIERNARTARDCERMGLVHMIEPRHALERRSPERKLDPAIMRAELGADLVKCIWPGSVDAMQEITATCPVPVLVAGGARLDDDPDRGLLIAKAAMDGGARGLVFGRSIYQSPDPGATLRSLRRVVHADMEAA